MNVEKTTEHLPSSQFEPKDSIKPSLIIGEKIVDYKAVMPKTSVGMLASSVSVYVDPHYSILNRHLLGSRVGYDGANVLMASHSLSDQVTKSYIGLSTYGIGYTPVVSDTSTKSELRRWPRNWFGDNIKN